MDLGRFSLSLSVKDVVASRGFYERLGFRVIDGHEDQKWLMMKNGDALLGLFEGMFDDNIITFNPPDVRSIQRALKEGGVESFVREADESSEGPAHAVLRDPDGNAILMDQF